MKNYVVWTNCVISEPDAQFGIEAAGRPGVREDYNRMFETSAASVREHLWGDWEAVVFDQPAESRVQMFQQNWQRIWDLWHSEPCNILYLDSDTVMLQPVQMFGRFDEFRMFNWCTPASNHGFLNYFNSGVRYYPATMTDHTWSLGQKIADNWRLDIWDQEQIIFNTMFWSQGLAWKDAHHPELNWQANSGRNIEQIKTHQAFNTVPLEQARIVHFHGSRSSDRGQSVGEMLCQWAQNQEQ